MILRARLATARRDPLAPARVRLRGRPARPGRRRARGPRLQRPARAADLPARRPAPAAGDHHRSRAQAKARADAAARRLGTLERTQKPITNATRVRVRALAGMNLLLQSKQGALQRARAAQQAALGASQARASGLQGADLEDPGRAGGGARGRGRGGGPGGSPERPDADAHRPPAPPSAPRAAGRSPTRSCCASRAARTCRPTAPAPRATTRSCPAPGSCSGARDRPPSWPARPSRTRWRAGSGTVAPAHPTGCAPASSASTDLPNLRAACDARGTHPDRRWRSWRSP